MCENPARGRRGVARCDAHFLGKRRIADCRDCGANRNEEIASRASHSGLCVACRGSCRVCGEPRSRSRSRAGKRLCDEHLREDERSRRKPASCSVCGGVCDGSGGRALCAPCRSTCLTCGGTRTGKPLRCNDCVRRKMFASYREAHGIDLQAEGSSSCRECGERLAPAENHHVIAVSRNYCSDACRNRAKCRRRRVARKGLPVERYAASDVFERDGWVCRLCEEPIDRSRKWPDGQSASIDHVLPVSLGGADVMANVQAAHLSCNIGKSNRMVA